MGVSGACPVLHTQHFPSHHQLRTVVQAPSLLQLPEIRAQDDRTCTRPPRCASFLQYARHNRGRSQIALDNCSPAPLLFLLGKGLEAHELSMASLITACGLTKSLRPSGLR